MKKLADLLIEYSEKIAIIEPIIDWGNAYELKHRMEYVAKRIYNEQYDLNNFYKSDFHLKSPQGEVWEHLDYNYPEFKEIGDKIKNELDKLKHH